MIQSFLVYGFMMFSTYFLGKKYVKTNSIYALIWIILIFVVFSAIRYDVGVDYLSYKFEYEHFQRTMQYHRKDMEVGFKTLSLCLAQLQCHYTIFFGVIALIQISFLFLTFRKEKYIIPYLILFMIASGEYFSWMNGMRQIMAFIFIIYAISQKNLKYSILIVLGASLFHTSALLMLPIVVICVLRNQLWIKRIDIRFCLIIIAYLLPVFISLEMLGKYIDVLISYVGYDRYDNASNIILSQKYELTMGPRYFIGLFSGLLITLYANKINEYYPKSLFSTFFNLFFIGIILTPLFRSSLHLMRFLYYFNSFIFIMDAYLFCYLNVKRPNAVSIWILYLFCALYLIITIIMSTNKDHILYQFCFL